MELNKITPVYVLKASRKVQATKLEHALHFCWIFNMQIVDNISCEFLTILHKLHLKKKKQYIMFHLLMLFIGTVKASTKSSHMRPVWSEQLRQ